MIVNIHEAKTHLSRLIEQFEQGEEIVVARNGKPVFKFAPVSRQKSGKRPLGFFGCKIDMTHFDEPLDGLEDYQ